MIGYACEYDNSGYAVAARRYIRALVGAGVDLRWEPLVNTSVGRVPRRGPAAAQSPLGDLHPRTPWPDSAHVRACIAHCMPLSWARVFTELPSSRRIGQTVWETGTVPTRWQQELAPADELWVPTRWNADVLRAAGWRRPIHVVPHVIEDGTPEPPPLDLPDDATIFVAVGAWEWRKRPDLTLAAFLRAFTADDDVLLVLKTGERTVSWPATAPVQRQTWWQVMNQVKQHRRAPAVLFDTASWSDAQIGGLYERAHAFVTLTATEGWGLGAFDAAAAGLPVVITGWGGQAEWLGPDHPFTVRHRMVPVDHPDRSMFEPGMTWAEADVDHASQLLRDVHRNRTEALRSARATAARLRQVYSPAAIGAQMKELLA